MINLSIGLFVVSALLGLTILIKWLNKSDASKTVIYAHGIVAASALLLLVVYALQHPDAFPKVSLGLFVASALGGFYMFFNDLRKKTSPLAIAFVHALLAASGLVTLILFVIA